MIGDAVVINKGASASIFAYGIPQSGNSAYATKGSKTVQGVWTTIGQNSGFLISPINELGTWTVHAIRDGVDRTTTVLVDAAEMYEVNTYSRLPAGYTEVSWIQSGGTQYIDTLVKGFTGVFIETSFEAVGYNGDDAVIGGKDTDNTRYALMLLTHEYNRTITFTYGVGKSLDSVVRIIGAPVFGNRYNIKAYCSVHNLAIFSDGALIDVKNPENKFYSTNANLLMFARTWNGEINAYSQIKMYSAKLYTTDNDLRNFVPCINPSNEVGMYDLVSNTFFTNAGTGVFVAGPEVVA